MMHQDHQPNNDIKIIIFDLGNVLVRLNDTDALWPELDKGGQQLNLRQEQWQRHPAVLGYESGKIDSLQEFYRQMAAGDRELIRQDAFQEAYNHIIGPLFSETIEILTCCARSYPLYLLSNTSPSHWNYVSRQYQLDRYFRDCFLSFKIGLMKPDRRIYETVLDHLQVPAGQIGYFDDRPENISQAKSFGIQSFLTLGGLELKSKLQNLQII